VFFERGDNVAHKIKKTKWLGSNTHVEYFIEAESDLADLPQEPSRQAGLGSIAYMLVPGFRMWVLMSDGWRESA
jgi:hypothetical protein